MGIEVHTDRKITDDVKTGSDRSFGIVFGIVFALIGLLPMLHSGAPRWWALAVAATFLGIALSIPRWLAPLNRLWMRFGLLLSRVTTPILMALVFFSTVTPIAVTMRLLGKDPLRLRRDPESNSYWIARSPSGPARGTMKNQF